jgi:lipid-binding SYLF domain-containing protein
MVKKNIFLRHILVLALSVYSLLWLHPAIAATGPQIDQEVDAALKTLYATSATAKALGDKAAGVLVFPNIVKGGFVLGAQGGDGALMKSGKNAGYYNSFALSVGWQAGLQSYAYAIFFVGDAAMKEFENSNGFEIGVGPNIVFLDAGAAKDMDTLTGKTGVYGMIFDQKGLMIGLSLQGAKITKINR